MDRLVCFHPPQPVKKQGICKGVFFINNQHDVDADNGKFSREFSGVKNTEM